MDTHCRGVSGPTTDRLPAGRTGNPAVSRKYVEWCLGNLNDSDSGPSVFADLAQELCKRRICSNLLPATQPSSGGDYGQDARSHGTWLCDNDGLPYLASAPITGQRLIFAFSIERKWKRKLKADAHKTVDNGLRPDRIIFVTNQPVRPERVKIDAERCIADEVSSIGAPVGIEIMDCAWIVQQLYGDDYDLAVRYLECPAEEDPRAREMLRRVYGLEDAGLPTDEATEVERLKQSLQFRHPYTGLPHLLARDLRLLGEILAQYESHFDEGLQWLREAVEVKGGGLTAVERVRASAVYFKALMKRPNGPRAILAEFDDFAESVVGNGLLTMVHEIPVWLMYTSREHMESSAWTELHAKWRTRLQEYPRDALGPVSLAHVDEALLFLAYLECIPDGDIAAWLAELSGFITRVESLRAFPIRRLCSMLSGVAPYLGHHSSFETVYEQALSVLCATTSDAERAEQLRDRALAHERAGQLQQAVACLSRSKALWLQEDTARGALLCCYSLAHWYESLGRPHAAEYELLQLLGLGTWQPPYDAPDVVCAAILSLCRLSMEQGRVLRGTRWALLGARFAHVKGLGAQSGKFVETLDANAPLLLGAAFRSHPELHDRLLHLLNEVDLPSVSVYRSVTCSDDHQFSEYCATLDPDSVSEARDLRRRVHAGDVTIANVRLDCDETADTLSLTSTALDYADGGPSVVTIYYPKESYLASVAFALAALLEEWSVCAAAKLHEVPFMPEPVAIRLHDRAGDMTGNLCVSFEQEEGTSVVSVGVPPGYWRDKLCERSTGGVLELLGQVLGCLLQYITLGPIQRAVELLDGSCVEPLAESSLRLLPPVHAWRSALAHQVLGEEGPDALVGG